MSDLKEEEVTIFERFLPALALFLIAFGVIVIIQIFLNRPFLCFGIGLLGIFGFRVRVAW